MDTQCSPAAVCNAFCAGRCTSPKVGTSSNAEGLEHECIMRQHTKARASCGRCPGRQKALQHLTTCKSSMPTAIHHTAFYRYRLSSHRESRIRRRNLCKDGLRSVTAVVATGMLLRRQVAINMPRSLRWRLTWDVFRSYSVSFNNETTASSCKYLVETVATLNSSDGASCREGGRAKG